jgi:hypothetical protein
MMEMKSGETKIQIKYYAKKKDEKSTNVKVSIVVLHFTADQRALIPSIPICVAFRLNKKSEYLWVKFE